MRERSGSSDDSRPIDVFQVEVNSSNSNTFDPQPLVGELNIATIYLDYQLRCTNSSISDPTASGKIPQTLLCNKVRFVLAI